jgi:ribonuclease VapC
VIVDTSALVAILLNEPEAERFIEVLLSADRSRLSAGTLLEAQLVAEGYRVGADLAELLDLLDAEILPFDERQAALALSGFKRFGKGRHRAGLNFGDCFAYAAARSLDEPLLYKGSDFSKTDVRAADVGR